MFLRNMNYLTTQRPLGLPCRLLATSAAGRCSAQWISAKCTHYFWKENLIRAKRHIWFRSNMKPPCIFRLNCAFGGQNYKNRDFRDHMSKKVTFVGTAMKKWLFPKLGSCWDAWQDSRLGCLPLCLGQERLRGASFLPPLVLLAQAER